MVELHRDGAWLQDARPIRTLTVGRPLHGTQVHAHLIHMPPMGAKHLHGTLALGHQIRIPHQAVGAERPQSRPIPGEEHHHHDRQVVGEKQTGAQIRPTAGFVLPVLVSLPSLPHFLREHQRQALQHQHLLLEHPHQRLMALLPLQLTLARPHLERTSSTPRHLASPSPLQHLVFPTATTIRLKRRLSVRICWSLSRVLLFIHLLDVNDLELWLVQLDIGDKTGLIVELRGTTVRNDQYPTGYAQGLHEGKRGVVKTATATAMSSGGSTTVKLLDSGEEIFPPPQFLKAVPPDAVKQLAVVLHGPSQGMRVQTVARDSAVEWVVLRPGNTYAEVKEEWMCRVEGS